MNQRTLIRLLGLLLLGGVIGEGLLGSSLMAANSYPPVVLGLHIFVALLLVALTALAFAVSLRNRSLTLRITSGIGLTACAGATVAGGVFLWGGQSLLAFHFMEYLTGLIFLVSIVLLVARVDSELVVHTPKGGRG
jgi:hypothetical protein